MLPGGPEPENTTSKPNFVSGTGTKEDPFVLKPLKKVEAGSTRVSTEIITIDNLSQIDVDMVDLNQEENSDRFGMCEAYFDNEITRNISVGESGEVAINIMFDDKKKETYEGGTFKGELKLGRASVYISWTVEIKPDKDKMKQSKPTTPEETMNEDDEEKIKTPTKSIKEENKKKTISKPTKEEDKAESLKRIRANASKIDFKVLGVAKESEKDDLKAIKGIGPFIEEKLNALGIYTYSQMSKMKGELEDQVNEAIEFFPGRVKRDEWVTQAKILSKK